MFFDQLVVRVSSGKLKEESHYYPFGLPIGSMGSAAAGFMENKHKYQSNAYNKEQGLNWMDFHNRQYDPQLGRFLAVDPLAANTPTASPYAAMDNDPANMVDPLGLQSHLAPKPGQTVSSLPAMVSIENMVNKGLNWKAASPNAPGGIAGWYSLVNLSLHNDATGTTSVQGEQKPVNNNANGDNGLDYSMIDYSDYKPVSPDGLSKNSSDINGSKDNADSKDNGPNRGIGGIISDINSFFGNATFIASNVLSFAETKTGRALAMGGAFQFKTSPFSIQKAMVNPVFAKIMGREITTLTLIKGTGKVLGGLGLAVSGADMIFNGVNASNTLDLAFGLYSMVPGVGWVVGGVYFIGNTAVKIGTGKDIGQHVQQNLSPKNLDNMADDIITYFSN